MNRDLRHLLVRREPDQRHRVAAIVDRGALAAQPELNLHIERYARCHNDALDLVAPPIVQGGGENMKDDATLPSRLQAYFHALELDRRSILLTVGGASLLDLAGFAASTMQSAPRVVRVPTTTLAQAGPAVLPKSSINAFGTKDFLCTFRAPFAVVCDRRFVETQKTREKVFGLVQAVRAALLWDEQLFGWIVAHAHRVASGERDAVAELLQRSAALHADLAAHTSDEEVYGPEGPLAFGAWAADRIELSTERRIRQGEALAVGIALDTTLGALHRTLGEADREAIHRLLERLGLRLWHDALGNVDSEGRLLLLDGLSERSFGHAPRVPLLCGIGRGVTSQELREDVLREAITRLAHRDAHRAHAFALA
ncbi:3-dehydroquinate synthase [Polyangium spumosum]|nr:3-dehydroquinate synthase [Polyangium spumosum]